MESEIKYWKTIHKKYKKLLSELLASDSMDLGYCESLEDAIERQHKRIVKLIKAEAKAKAKKKEEKK